MDGFCWGCRLPVLENLGFPIGSAFAGVVAARSIETAILVAVVTSFAAAILAILLVPSNASIHGGK
ncbi:MAG: hypothetical protein DMG15_26560 [Acidobacteria bacterium]|nr:MAG: hypothetical protein DMG15_26560 [Acidobacteriota bacterium]